MIFCAAASLLPGLAMIVAGQEALPDIAKAGPPTKESKRVTDRPGNRLGKVLVLMYHRAGPDESNMVRSFANFKKDLSRMYTMGFRPVTLNEYVTNTMELERGASPVVITFDDSHQSQFSMKADGSIDPNCFVGIWKAFADENPDFPVKGTFFVLPNGPFAQGKFREAKLKFLKDNGCEIGSHSMTHTALNKLTDDEVKKELVDSYTYVSGLGFTARSFATPYGIAPKNRSLLESFEWKGSKFGYDNICLAGASPAPSPLSKQIDRTRIPRIKAYEGEYGVTYWLNRVSNEKLDPYVQP